MNKIIRLFKENADPENFNSGKFEKEIKMITSDLPLLLYTLDCTNTMDYCVKNLQSMSLQYRKIPHLKKYANNLLYQLEDNFSDYLNLDKGCSADNVHKLVSDNIDLIHEIYEVVQASGSPLWPTIESFLIPIKNCGITFHQLVFTQDFFKKLEKFKENYSLNDTAKFIRFLQHINLNTVQFFDFIINGIEEELSNIIEKEDQINYLNHQYISFKHLKYVNEQRFNKLMPDLGEQVSEWISTNISLIKQNELNYNQNPTEKIEFTGTTYVLILFHLLLMELGFYSNTSKKTICRFISNNYFTKKAPFISPDKSYEKIGEISNDVRTKEALKSLLLQILKKLG